MKAFQNAQIYVGGVGIVKTSLAFDEKIVSIGGECGAAEGIGIPDGCTVLPAFIDEHIHGAGGADAMDASAEALGVIAREAAKEGTAAFLATTMTQSEKNISGALRAAAEYAKTDSGEGAELLGVHLEGPFISEKYAGAQPKEYIVSPGVDLFDKFDRESGGIIKIVTLAPEIEGADELIAHLKKKGVIASIGHSAANEADVAGAIGLGASNVTHTGNAQSPLHQRDPGVFGSALLYDELNAEVIADTVHVSVGTLKLIAKCKGKEKITLVTDAMRAKGMPDGKYELGGNTVFVSGGEARLSDGTLAGSVLRMNEAVRNMVEKVGMSLTDAVDCASLNPARTLGIADRKGSIAVGKDADFCVIDKDFHIIMTIRAGKVIYHA